MKLWRRLIAWLVLALSAGNVGAQVLVGTRWDSLTPLQREALAPLGPQWAKLDPASQDTWAAVARRYPSLSPVEQQRLRERMQLWANMSPQERDQARRGHEQSLHVPAPDRAAKWERFQALPPERKQALLDRASTRSEAVPAAPPSRPLAGVQAQLDGRTLLPRRPAASAP